MRAVTEAVLALAPKPGGFTVGALADKTRALLGPRPQPYTPRQAAYDLRKLRGKANNMFALAAREGATLRHARWPRSRRRVCLIIPESASASSSRSLRCRSISA